MTEGKKGMNGWKVKEIAATRTLNGECKRTNEKQQEKNISYRNNKQAGNNKERDEENMKE